MNLRVTIYRLIKTLETTAIKPDALSVAPLWTRETILTSTEATRKASTNKPQPFHRERILLHTAIRHRQRSTEAGGFISTQVLVENIDPRSQRAFHQD